MDPVRSRLELRMELNTDEPWVVFNFHHLNETFVRRYSGNLESGICELFPILVIVFITMSVSLINQDILIGFNGL